MEATNAAGFQDQFLNLLTTQLRNQDPLEPTKQEDFIAQLAQFTELEGIEKLNSNLSTFLETQTETQDAQAEKLAELQQVQNMSMAADLIGSEVAYGKTATNEAANGVVDAVVFEDQSIHLRIGDNLVPLSQINGIGDGVADLLDLPSSSS